MEKKKVSIGFLGNINFDTRTYNLVKSLQGYGHEVKFNGFDWLTPEFETFETESVRVEKLNKTSFSVLFYLKFGLKLFSRLMKQKSDIYFASDLYSLPFCTIAAKLKRKKVFYDSREVYTEIPALNSKKFVKRLVKIIEGHYIKKCDYIVTTGRMDSDYIENLYNLPKTDVLRNLPLPVENITPVDYKTKFKNYNGGKIILYQGIIVLGRGIETYFDVVKKYDKCYLVLLGGGEDGGYYEKMAAEMGIEDKVHFAGKVPQNELLNYTAGADIGLSLIDNISKNNYYALPNKLFEYIMAGIPVIASDMPQMKKIVDKFNVGKVVPEGAADELIEIIEKWNDDKEDYNSAVKSCKPASEELNWNKEFEKIYNHFI
ncbi:MAG: glycosyltransferase [Rhodothermaceae bacterium]